MDFSLLILLQFCNGYSVAFLITFSAYFIALFSISENAELEKANSIFFKFYKSSGAAAISLALALHSSELNPSEKATAVSSPVVGIIINP